MPAMAPPLRPERCGTTAAAALVVDAGAFVDDAVGDEVEDEELVPVTPGGLDSSGKFYLLSACSASVRALYGLLTWPGCSMKEAFSAPVR